MRTKSILTVAHLRKYLARKMGLAADVNTELFCRDQPLESSINLEAIFRTVWLDETEDLVLDYRVG